MTDGPPLSPPQVQAALTLGKSLWPDKDRDETLATYFDLVRSPEAIKRQADWNIRDGEQEIASGTEIDQALKEVRLLLLPAILHVEALYTKVPRQWPGVFARLEEADEFARAEERRYTGLAQLRPRGAPVMRDSKAGQVVHVYHLERRDIALAARIKRTVIDDGSYPADFAATAIGLSESFYQSEEILHANVLNTGNIYDASIGGDGCPLFSDKHPCGDAITYSNLGDVELGEAGLKYARERILKFCSPSGLRLSARPRMLIVPMELELQARRLLQSPEAPCFFPEGYRVFDFLTDPKAWFIKTSFAGLWSKSWQPFRLDFAIEGRDLLLEGTQSYGIGHYNPRACFGSYPKERT